MSGETLSEVPATIVKEQTGDLHEMVEGLLGQRFFDDDEFTREDLVTLLSSFYRIYQPLEESLVPAVGEMLPEYDSRSDRIEKDLRTLGFDETDINDIQVLSSDRVVELENDYRVLGCLYVVEGSEMGNQVIRKHLEKTLPESSLDADRFFRRKVDGTRERWNRFKNLLNDRVVSREAMGEVVDGARQTFEMFGTGFE